MIDQIDKHLTEIDIESMKDGFAHDEKSGCFHCLFCDETYEEGIIYPHGEMLFEARRAIRQHVRDAHGDVFKLLLDLGKEQTGVSEIQRDILQNMYNGASDKQIALKLGGKSVSTIRNHRFQLRKRMKEARIFLALMQLLEERDMNSVEYVDFKTEIPNKDERFIVTKDEEQKIKEKFFNKGPGLSLKSFPKKQKVKLVILNIIAEIFEAGKKYSETEVNEMLAAIYDDYPAVRRYLIDYQFIERKADGSSYWKK